MLFGAGSIILANFQQVWHVAHYGLRVCPPHYQILQTFSRTIASPFLHPNAFANSSMFESGPFTRNFGTGCSLLFAINRANSGRKLAPHTCAQPRKNLCSGLKPPSVGGRFPSIDFSYAA